MRIGLAMVANFKVLILDDDELWLARHERRLGKAGLEFCATQDAKEAIKIAKTDPYVKFALIDEILYVTPIPLSEEDRELQRWQGTGVIREITAQRNDLQIIIVTAAPKQKSGDNLQVFRRETAKLRRQRGVIDVVHKVDIEEDPEDTYGWLIDLIERPSNSVGANVVTPKVLIGLGFTKEEHEAIAEQMGVPRRQYLSIAPLLQKGGTKILDAFLERSKEKSVLLEMPGSKQLDRLTNIKPDSSAFQILAFLAQQTEKKADVIICERNYKHASRQSKKNQIDVHTPEYDAIAVKAYVFEPGEDGRKKLRQGVQIERRQEQTSPLKVAIHRLRLQLSKLNVGPARQLFKHEQDGYRPQFELGIVLYTIKTQSTKRQANLRSM
jgi:CheY-like chemotaxis protein